MFISIELRSINSQNSWISIKINTRLCCHNVRGRVDIALTSVANGLRFDSQRGEKVCFFFRVFSEINKYQRKKGGYPLLSLAKSIYYLIPLPILCIY